MRSFSLNCFRSSSSGSSMSSRSPILPPRPLSGVVSEVLDVSVISMYFHLHSTHSTPPLDTLGALWYHSGDHPQFTSLCHHPDILVSNFCLNSLDLVTSGPWDPRTF